MNPLVADISAAWIRGGGKRHVERLRTLTGVMPLPGSVLAPMGRRRGVLRSTQVAEDAFPVRPGGERGNERLFRGVRQLVAPSTVRVSGHRIAPVLAQRLRIPATAAGDGTWARLAVPATAVETFAAHAMTSPAAAEMVGGRQTIRFDSAGEAGGRVMCPGRSLAPPVKREPPDRAVSAAARHEGGTHGEWERLDVVPSVAGSTASRRPMQGDNPGHWHSNDVLSGNLQTAAAGPGLSTLHIDGAELGRWTIEHLSRALARPAMGMTSIDPRAIVPRSRVSPF